ncbi:MAG: hypothetical protein ACXWVI_00435 [Methyloceanibacter sp.]
MLPDHATPRTLTFLASFCAVLCLGASPSRAEQCVASFREIEFPDGSARVKNYVCKTDGSSEPQVRVEFDRLSEAAAGSLIQGEPYPDMERAFGKVRLVNNAVAAETKKIFDQFGIKKVVDYLCYSFQVSTAAGGTGYEVSGGCGEQRTLWFLKQGNIEMPLIPDVERYRASTQWPASYNFTYSECTSELDPIGCTSLWRAARPKDFANYSQNMVAYNRMLDLEADSSDEIVQADNSGEMAPEYEDSLKYFALVDYLTGGNWPDDFVIISGRFAGCAEIEFLLEARELILDVAFLQNLSDRPVSIDGLLGSEVEEGQLRKKASAGTTSTGRISLATEQLQPGETIAVPLAISFVADEFGDQAESEKVFKRIQASKSGAIFQQRPSGPIRKVRESFDPPKAFKPATYMFGPELRLSGLVMDGKSIVFDQASRNFMQLASFTEEGSCPYLYSWDDGLKTWVHHGKVIHVANGKDKEATETRQFEGFRAKFRLAEEELELSYIDHVKLEIELKDGGGMTLAPDFAAMNAKDGSYATIKAGDRIEFSFALPPSLKPEDVKQSTLAITGYYRRYSDLLMAQQ